MAKEIADSTLLDTWSSGGNIVEPDISKIIEGWQLGEQPPHEYMNWLQNTFGSKLNHILKNGVASWNNETEYLAGSSVKHSGNVWLCKATNTSSEPTDVNANWKRIITVEALTTILDGYVDTNTNQDIDGIKNFLTSPTVPTPTTGTQAVNKDYVDSTTTLNINGLTAKATPDNTDNFAIQETGGLLKKLSWANLKATLVTYLSTGTGFAISLTTNGYIKLPNWLGGFIIQWGTSTIGASGTYVTLPIAFPNNMFAVTAGLTDAGLPSGTLYAYRNGTSLSQIILDFDITSTGTATYIAIGN